MFNIYIFFDILIQYTWLFCLFVFDILMQNIWLFHLYFLYVHSHTYKNWLILPTQYHHQPRQQATGTLFPMSIWLYIIPPLIIPGYSNGDWISLKTLQILGAYFLMFVLKCILSHLVPLVLTLFYMGSKNTLTHGGGAKFPPI